MPAIIFDRLPEDHVVQMFVTINAKHTRLNASHLVSLSGRQLYRDEALADGARRRARAERPRGLAALRRDQAARRRPRPRGAGAAGAGTQEAVCGRRRFGDASAGDMHEEAKKFFVNYFKQIALVFGGAWNGRKYSIRSASALRAFIRVAPDVIRRLDQEHADRTDFRAIGRVIAPWGRRIGDLRFETEGAWKRGGHDRRFAGQGTAARAQYPKEQRFQVTAEFTRRSGSELVDASLYCHVDAPHHRRGRLHRLQSRSATRSRIPPIGSSSSTS